MLNLDTLKEFINLDPKRQLILALCLVFGGSIYLLHQDNQAKAAIIATKDRDCQEMIKKCQIDASEQIRQSRENYEKELNSFIISSNMERDSIYRFFYKKIRIIDSRVSSNINKINEIKDEIRN